MIRSARDCILRLEWFLNKHNIRLSTIKMQQVIGSERHFFEFYDTDEIQDLEKSAGILYLHVEFIEVEK